MDLSLPVFPDEQQVPVVQARTQGFAYFSHQEESDLLVRTGCEA